jgi:hypothetical protein
VAVAAVLGAVCLAGGPLYVSAAGSAAATDQLAHTCASNSALILAVPDVATIDQVAMIGAAVPHVDPPTLNTYSTVGVVDVSGSRTMLRLIAKEGAAQQVTPELTPLGPNELAIAAQVARILDLQIGDHLSAQASDRRAVDLQVTQIFGDLPFSPEPSYWCGYSDLLRPRPSGDPPPAWAIVSSQTQAVFADEAFSWLEYRPTSEPITMHDARQMQAGYEGADEALTEVVNAPPSDSQLPALLVRATSLAAAVDKAVAPVRLAGVLAAALVLAAAAVMLADERRRELRLLALRGVSPWQSARRMIVVVAGPISAGMALGFVLAFVAVRTLGPSSQVERAAVTSAGISVGIGWMVAVLATGVGVAFVGDGFVDRQRTRSRWRVVPYELAVVVVAIVSYRRLRDTGGLQLFGTQSRGGELLAQAFPLLGVIAVAVVLFRPIRMVATLLRLAGKRLPRGMRLGVRRAFIEPGITSILVVAISVSCGCYTLSQLLSASAQQQLTDKALNYVGADLSVRVFDDVPPALADRSTMVSQYSGVVDRVPVDVLGVDRATFASVAQLRADGATTSLDSLMGAIEPTTDTALPAVLVGDPSLVGRLGIESPVHAPGFSIDVVASADFFPGSSTGVTVVVDRAALIDRVGYTQQAIWFRDPPPDIVEQMRSAGVRVGGVIRATAVFDTTNYRAQKWSYDPLSALGALFAAVAIALQLLIVEARGPNRRQSHVVLRRTGFGAGPMSSAALLEAGIPAVIGAVIGAAAGTFFARLSVRWLDSLAAVRPEARLVVPVEPFAVLAAAVALTVLVVAGLIIRSTLRGDPMEAIRGTP